MTSQPTGASSLSGSIYSGSPDNRLATKRFLNTSRVLPSRTNFARSGPNSTLKIASGLASSIAWTMIPASTLPRGGLLGHDLGVGLRLLEHLLEALRRRLPIFEIGVDQRPPLFLRGHDVRHQHGDLHVGRGPQPVGVFVAVLPGDLVGERFCREEEHLLLAGELGHREADIGEKRAGDQVGRFRSSTPQQPAPRRPDWRRRRARRSQASCPARRRRR